MERTLQQVYFKNRLCRTLLRVNWLIAVATILPVLSKIFMGAAFFATAFYLLILVAITIITLGIFLLDESFRALYAVDLDGLQELSNQIIDAYRVAMPIFTTIFAIITGVIFVVVITNHDEMHKTSKIVSISVASLIVLVSVIIYYINLI